MIKVAFATLGCKVNQYDTAAMVQAIGSTSIVPFNSPADCYIVNTCTVTAKTDYQSRQLIRRAIRCNPEACVIVTGCYAQRAPDELMAIPGVTVVAGNSEKDDIVRIIGEMVRGRRQIMVGDIKTHAGFPLLDAADFPGHTRAFLKIQDGCNARCSYCIVPLVRGPARSLPENEVLRRIGILAEKGYREIVLTGIHIGTYGQDLSPRSNIAAMIEKIIRQRSIERLRLSSIEPQEVTDDLISLIKENRTICHHLHIPLQSGDDRILADMNRVYDTGFFMRLADKLVQAIPELAIGIDIMAGFPGEDEESFIRSSEFAKSLPVAYFHVFPYSQRPGTPASVMAAQVGEQEKKRRAQILRDIGLAKRNSFMNMCLGSFLDVLIENAKDKTTGLMKGFSDHYMPVLVRNGNRSHANKIVRVAAEAVKDGKIIGTAAGI